MPLRGDPLLRHFRTIVITSLILGYSLGCKYLSTSTPKITAPEGTIIFALSEKIASPIFLTLNDTRINVTANINKGNGIKITGLSPGEYRFYLTSPTCVFGPDFGVTILPDDQGIVVKVQVQPFDNVLYESSGLNQNAPGPIKAELIKL